MRGRHLTQTQRTVAEREEPQTERSLHRRVVLMQIRPRSVADANLGFLHTLDRISLDQGAALVEESCWQGLPVCAARHPEVDVSRAELVLRRQA